MTTGVDGGAGSEGRVLAVHPYLLHGTWVFDDERTGLTEEAFVLGATEMISRLVEGKGIAGAAAGFRLEFSDRPFAGQDAEIAWQRADPLEGNWYAGTVFGLPMECWLCPALLLYFEAPPRRICVRATPLPPGVDPRWIPPEGTTPRRFVEPPRP